MVLYYYLTFMKVLFVGLQIFTWVGMSLLAGVGFFFPKKIPAHQLLPLAIGYVGYIVLCNLSLNLNSVGFYQVIHSHFKMTTSYINDVVRYNKDWQAFCYCHWGVNHVALT
jgi:hypothetical protein